MVAPRHLVDEAAHEKRFAALREEVREETGSTIAAALAQGVIPSGVIVMWSGATTAIPTGWALCNGASGTPDLRNRFVVGAGSTYAAGATGGETTHTHTATIGATTLTTAQMPSHTHGATIPTTGGTGNARTVTVSSAYGQHTWTAGFVSTAATGGGGSHTHTGTAAASSSLPPYFALAYIMKL